MSEAILVETVTDTLGLYVREWHCEPPGFRVSYRVIDEEWQHPLFGEGALPIRRIYQIELT